MSQIIDDTHNETLTYTYDALDRLDTVSGAYSQDYDYDKIGNITNKTTTTSTSYSYGDPAHKHAVTTLGTDASYTYDDIGNMTCRVENEITYKQEYDAENRLSAVSKMNGSCTTGTVVETWNFTYDGDGNLVKKSKVGGSRTIYIGDVYEEEKSSSGAVTRRVTYYPAAGAMRIQTDSSNQVYYILKDHLGSASVVTNTSGTVVTGADLRYLPFGEARSGTSSMLTDKLYTGQREMAELGIYHYKARFYSPYINRFLSADSIVPNPANPQSLSRYSYVTNNPLRYTDPTGHRACGDDAVINCETGRLNRPSNHTNKGCGGPNKPCLGKPAPKKDNTYITNPNAIHLGQPTDPGDYIGGLYGNTIAVNQYNFNHVGGDGECVGIFCSFSGGGVPLKYRATYNIYLYEHLQIVELHEDYWISPADLPLMENPSIGGSVLVSQFPHGQASTNLGAFRPGNVAHPNDLVDRVTAIHYWGAGNSPTQITIRLEFGAQNRGTVRVDYPLSPLPVP